MASNQILNKTLTFQGINFLRQRLVLSCLSGKKIHITDIRSKEEKPGVREYEISLIRLFDQISNGAKIEVGRAGTSFTFIPGILLGGEITHNCDPARGIGYYLEPIMMLAPFCKKPLHIILKGITNCDSDVSVDQLRYSMLEVLRKFLITDDGLKLTVLKRGLPPVAGGHVEFCCPIRRELKPFQWVESGQVRKVRGMCFTRRVAPVVGNRIIDKVKHHINQYLTDVYFVCDNSKGPAPGFGISINCVTTKGTYYSAEALSCQQLNANGTSSNDSSNTNASNNSNEGNKGRILSPEEVAEEAVFRLLEEIRRGGCVDSYSQPIVLLFMVLGPKDVSKIMLGPLTTQAMYMLRHIRDFFSVTFKIDRHEPEESIDLDEDGDDDEDMSKKRALGADKVLLTCVGTGFVNFSKGNL
uniref:RNA 3'-terminal phosphate cyclase-like protein n=1 Tax=Hirondellea gigas TaxID=1518452 RepID=A0A2P2I5U9_9CRUS